MKKLVALLLVALVLTGCSGGGSSTNEESFVSGDGAHHEAQTFTTATLFFV